MLIHLATHQYSYYPLLAKQKCIQFQVYTSQKSNILYHEYLNMFSIFVLIHFSAYNFNPLGNTNLSSCWFLLILVNGRAVICLPSTNTLTSIPQKRFSLLHYYASGLKNTNNQCVHNTVISVIMLQMTKLLQASLFACQMPACRSELLLQPYMTLRAPCLNLVKM